MCTYHPVVNDALKHLKIEKAGEKTIGIHGIIYDVSSFALVHPGGSFLFDMHAGYDATTLYESVHIDIKKTNQILDTLPVLGNYKPNVNFCFQRYGQLRQIVLEIFPTRKSRSLGPRTFYMMNVFMVAALVVHVLLLFTPLVSLQWCVYMVISSTLNAICGSYGHSSVHRFHWTSILLDWNGLSCYEWILEHVMSHHPYVNTSHDHDAISIEPFLRWIPSRKRAWFGDAQQTSIALHLINVISELVVSVQGLFVHRCRWEPLFNTSFPLWLRFAPFVFLTRIFTHLLIAIMSGGGAAIYSQTISFLATVLLSGFYFSTLAHMNHTNTCIHTDFLQHQLGNTIDLSIPGPLFLFLDRQKVHHLFPSIDHGRWTKTKQNIVLRNSAFE